MSDQENVELEMGIAGIMLDPSTEAPIVILREKDTGLVLPIWIGVAEATSIASVLKGSPLSRPLSHDLLRCVIEELGGKVERVLINKLENNTFFAVVEIAKGQEVKILDSRPSDAIALAIRSESPIFVARQVLEQAQALVGVIQDSSGGAQLQGSNNQEAGSGQGSDLGFADLSQEEWSKILSDMSPEDFKYKM